MSVLDHKTEVSHTGQPNLRPSQEIKYVVSALNSTETFENCLLLTKLKLSGKFLQVNLWNFK